jgi:hypothetical protein
MKSVEISECDFLPWKIGGSGGRKGRAWAEEVRHSQKRKRGGKSRPAYD